MRPHALFEKDGNDLVMIQMMLILEALVGKTLDMTTLDGRDIAIQVTDIVKPAYELVDSLMKVCHLQRILSNADN
jgi:DnaJ family protein B protein 4